MLGILTKHPSPATPFAPSKEPITAPHPFDRTDADIVLRSSDLVDFHVFSQVLLAASPFFEGMFDIPQPPLYQQQLKDGRPIIEVSEESVVLDTILRICYPINNPSEWSLEEVEPALRAAIKYEMELPTTVLTTRLKSLIPVSPFQVWAIACRLRLEEVASIAADEVRCTGKTPQVLARRHPILRFEGSECLDGVSAGDFYRLCEYDRSPDRSPGRSLGRSPGRSIGRSQGRSLGRSPGLPSGGVKIPGFSFHEHSGIDAPVDPLEAGTIDSAHETLSNYPSSPDIICRTSDGVEFFAHFSILYAASSQKILGNIKPGRLYNEQHKCNSPQSTSATHPIVSFDLCGSTLAALLLLCYNRDTGLCPRILSHPTHCLDVLAAAVKYDFHFVQPIILSRWQIAMERGPVQAYLAAAATSGHAARAKEAAQCTIAKSVSGVYVPELECAFALVYRRLLVYDEKCHRITTDHLERTLATLHVPPPSNNDAYNPPSPLLTAFSIIPSGPADPIFHSARAKKTNNGKLVVGRDRVDGAPQSTWVRRLISLTIGQTSISGSRVVLPALGELFAKATKTTADREHMWCEACQPLAEDILKVDHDHRLMVRALDEASRYNFYWL